MKRFRTSPRYPRRVRGAYSMRVCPETGEDVLYSSCMRCEQYRDWAGDEGYETDGMEECYHDFVDRVERGAFTSNHGEHMDQVRKVNPDRYKEMVEEQEAIDQRAAEWEAEHEREQLAREQRAHLEETEEEEDICEFGDEDDDEDDDDT